MDIKTLFVFISIAGICILLLSIYVYSTHTRVIEGSLYWLGSILAISLSSILFGLAGVMPAQLNVHLSNSLLLVAPTLMSLSLRRLYKVNTSTLPLVLYALSFIGFNLGAPILGVNGRIVLFSAFFGVLWMDPAYLALRNGPFQSDRLLGGAFAIVSGFSFLRAAITALYEREMSSLLEGGPTQQFYVVMMGVALFVFLAGYILMLNSRILARIRTSEATLRAAIDNSPYAMVMTDDAGRVVSANGNYEKMTGYSVAELQAGGLTLLRPDRHEATFPQEIWEVLRRGENWDDELYNMRKNGSHYWEKAVWSPIHCENGKITGFFGVTTDVTQKKQLEDFKNEIENLMRHDLKTPLNAVINLPEFIRSEGGLNSEQKEFLDAIRESGESMLEQINGSLEMYKVEAGTYRVHYEKTDLRKVLGDFQKTFLPLAVDRGVTLECLCEGDAAGGEPRVSTDLSLFRRLLGNLIKNAIEASPKGSVVTVRVTRDAGSLAVEVHNPGVIPLEARGRFFSKFNTFGKFNGTGLGAYGAKLAADFLGYELSFTTDEKDGTTLRVCLPLSRSLPCS